MVFEIFMMSGQTTKSSTEGTGPGLEGGPFSSEVLSKDSPWQSPALVKIPKRLGAWAIIAIFLFLISTFLVIFIPWTQTVSVHGRLSSYFPGQRPQKIHSPIRGRILGWQVTEGIQVTQGQVVLELGDIDPKFMAPDLINQLNQSRDALKKQREAALEQAEILEQRLSEMTALVQSTLSKAEAKVSEANNKIQTYQQRIPPAEGAVETAKLNLERMRQLENKGLVSRRELELAIQKLKETEAEVKTAQAKLQETQDSQLALVHDREKIQAELTQTLLETKTKRASALGKAAKFSKELADLELKRSNALHRSQARKVEAPFDGVVVRLSPLGQGEIVKEGSLLFTLAPINPTPAVEMWADPIDAPLLRQGAQVRLLFQGTPAIPLPAWPELMAGTFDGVIKVVDQAANPEERFRLWVVPETKRRMWPPQKQIRPGTKVRGWVMLNRVPLWYEIWRRFNLFPPDFHSGETGEKGFIETLLPKAGRPKK
jgi:multidrug resistance efflux pump